MNEAPEKYDTTGRVSAAEKNMNIGTITVSVIRIDYNDLLFIIVVDIKTAQLFQKYTMLKHAFSQKTRDHISPILRDRCLMRGTHLEAKMDRYSEMK